MEKPKGGGRCRRVFSHQMFAVVVDHSSLSDSAEVSILSAAVDIRHSIKIR